MRFPEARLLSSPLDAVGHWYRERGHVRRAPRYLYLTLGPLRERVRRGEGALLVINAAIIWFLDLGALTGAVQLALSFVVLAVLYAVNDLRDAEDDRTNPKKNPRLVATFLQEREDFAVFIGAVQVGLLLRAYALLGLQAAAVLLSLFAVNLLYSVRLKGVPFADVVLVGLWGSLYSALPGPPWRICALVGLMTGVCHVFQILGDRHVDAANRVRTTAVLSTRTTTAVLAGICGALFAALVPELGPGWALTAFMPLALHLAPASSGTAWMLSRVYFGLAILAVLGGVRGPS